MAGYPCCNTQGNINTTLTNLAPRLGIAYQLNSRTILRAAYGRNFDQRRQRYSGLRPPIIRGLP